MRICTTNPGKRAEFGGLLAPLDIDLKITSPDDPDVPEPFDTFTENAFAKCQGYAEHYPGEYILAEDSGLVVPHLGGLPGPWSARFADFDPRTREVRESGRSRDVIDPLNNQLVLGLLRSVPPEARGAYFEAVIVVLAPDGRVVFQIEDRAYGWITQEPKGEGGFGYDPIFESAETFGKTWAQVDRARKNLISHRTKAITNFMLWVCGTKEPLR